VDYQGNKFREWIKLQESFLHQQAELAGLLSHSSTIGTAREFLVKRVLQAVLPPLIHVGSGIIVDAHDTLSKQIDVVLYDSRFPLMEFEQGVGIYPIEGVIATIEVKTDLSTTDSLTMALDNCYSVLSLRLASPNPKAIRTRANGLKDELAKSQFESRIHAGCEVVPATYVFAYSGFSVKSLCATAGQWFRDRKEPMLQIGQDAKNGPCGLCPGLPRVIVSGKSVGIAHDGWFNPLPSPEEAAKIQAQVGEHYRVMMAFWASEVPYWWLASHILHTACSRLGMSHAASGLRYKIDHYIDRPEDMKNPEYLLSTKYKE
jgi:hypothetical protein